MASKTSMAYHAYQAKSPMNQGKVEALRALLPVWRAGLTLAMSCWMRPFVQSGVLPRWIDSKGFPDMLSQRQWDSVDRQARAALDSWIALREDEFRKTVNGSTLSPDLKHALHRINLRHAWWESVADDAHKMARRIIKHLRERVPFPDMRRCRTMSMDGKIARVGTPVNAFHFQYWAVVSTLDKGHPVRIPLTVDPRMNENTLHGDEQAANHLQARINRDGSIDLHLMTVKAKARKRSSGPAGDPRDRRRGTRLPQRRPIKEDEQDHQPGRTKRRQSQAQGPGGQQGDHRHQGQPRVHQPGMPQLRLREPTQPANAGTLPLHMLRIPVTSRHQRQPQHTRETFPRGRMASDRPQTDPRHAPTGTRRTIPPHRWTRREECGYPTGRIHDTEGQGYQR